MTSRRVAAFAQALAIVSIILGPGLQPGGPAAARAAVAPAAPSTGATFDATGNGIGCQAGSGKFKGPRTPKDPPWPPGAEPTPDPAPEQSVESSASPGPLEPELSPGPVADAPTMLLASTGVRVAQADPTADATALPEATDAVETTPEATASTGKKKGKSKLVAGIDVSHHNQEIDFGKVRDADKHFVFIKATESNDFIDPRFLTNIAAARAAGMAASGYHVFDYTLDGKTQADHFVDRLEAANAIEGTLPPVVDVECWGYRGTSTHVVSEARLRDFVARLYQRTGRLPILYTSLYMWGQVVGDPKGFEDLPLWAVCWSCASPPSLASGWDDWVFWQTGFARIKGLGKKLDGNVFSGSSADLEAMKLRPLSVANGLAVTGSQRVDLDLGGRDATQLRTSLDGEQWSAWTPVRAAARAELGPEEAEQTLHVQLRAGRGTRSPVYRNTITLDRSGPEVDDLAVTLREGSLGDGARIPVTITWTARDEIAGLSDAVVSVSCAEGQAVRVEAPGSAEPGELAAWQAAATMLPDASCDVMAISRDGVGNTTRRSIQGLDVTVMPARDAAASVRGSQVGLIAQRGPDAGRAAVMLDGEAIALVDLYAPASSGPEVVHILDLEPDASHQVELVGTGTSDPASGGTSIVVDGFVTLSWSE